MVHSIENNNSYWRNLKYLFFIAIVGFSKWRKIVETIKNEMDFVGNAQGKMQWSCGCEYGYVCVSIESNGQRRKNLNQNEIMANNWNYNNIGSNAYETHAPYEWCATSRMLIIARTQYAPFLFMFSLATHAKPTTTNSNDSTTNNNKNVGKQNTTKNHHFFVYAVPFTTMTRIASSPTNIASNLAWGK